MPVTAPSAPSGITTPPPVGTGPTPFRWSISAYRELGKTGLFDDMKTLLIDGEIFTMGMPDPPHDTALTLAFAFLMTTCPAGHYVRNQQGFDIGTQSDPGPDLAIVAGSARDYSTRTPTTAVMILEVASTSLFLDTTKKAELYATAGVPEYWVLDVINRQLHVFRDPAALPAGLGATAYKTHRTLAATDTISPLHAPHATLTVADVLP